MFVCTVLNCTALPFTWPQYASRAALSSGRAGRLKLLQPSTARHFSLLAARPTQLRQQGDRLEMLVPPWGPRVTVKFD